MRGLFPIRHENDGRRRLSVDERRPHRQLGGRAFEHRQDLECRQYNSRVVVTEKPSLPHLKAGDI